MKGIIVYSSRTGNTKRMAQAIYEGVRDLADFDLVDMGQDFDLEAYDLALIGGYADRAYPNKNAKSLIEEADLPLGIFLTMGAMPDSDHGLKTAANMEQMLRDKTSLGYYACPGLVDKAMIDMLKAMPPGRMPQELVDRMVKTSEKSRQATEAELEAAGAYFRTRIGDFLRGK